MKKFRFGDVVYVKKIPLKEDWGKVRIRRFPFKIGQQIVICDTYRYEDCSVALIIDNAWFPSECFGFEAPVEDFLYNL